MMGEDAMEVPEGSSNGDDAAESSVVFSRLKSCCLELLDLLQNPKKQSPALSHLLHLLRSSPPEALQPLFEYVLLRYCISMMIATPAYC